MSGAQVSTIVVEAVLCAAEDRGLDRAVLLEEAGLPAREIADPDHFVDIDRHVALWKAIMQKAGDRSFGVRAGLALGRGALYGLEYAIRTSPTFGEGLYCLVRFGRLLRSIDVVEITNDDTGLVSVVLVPLQDWHPEHVHLMTDFGLAALVGLGRDATGLDWVPRQVHFRHPAPEDPSFYELLGPSILFDQAETKLVLDPELMAKPMLEADPVLHGIMERFAAEHIAKYAPTAPFATQVRKAILGALRHAEPDLEHTAKVIELSPRVVQRRLQDEGTSYREVLEDVRESMARKYLSESELPLLDVALLLGYSDATAFHRAFKRWTGVTPGEFRRKLAG